MQSALSLSVCVLQNPENTIGLMTMACLPSECPRVRVTPAVNQVAYLLVAKMLQQAVYAVRIFHIFSGGVALFRQDNFIGVRCINFS